MKKMILVLALVAIVAAPAMAVVTLTSTVGTTASTRNVVTVSFVNDDAGVGKKVRAFALDVTISGTNNCISTGLPQPFAGLSTGYWVYPGTIVISGGKVTSVGTPFCAITAKGVVSPLVVGGKTYEMGSLYSASDPNHLTAPPQNPGGNLFKFIVKNAGTVHIASNAMRGGVVLEDGTVVVPVSADLVIPVDATRICTKCKGNLNADPVVSAGDLTVLVQKLNGAAPNYRITPTLFPALWNPCGDLNNDGAITPSDLTVMQQILNSLAPTYSQACSARCP